MTAARRPDLLAVLTLLTLVACTPQPALDTGTSPSTTSSSSGEPDTGDIGDTGDTSDTGDTGDTGGEVVEFEVLVNNRGMNAIMRYASDGGLVDAFIPSGSGGLSSPEDVLLHPDGTLIVSGFGNAALLRFDGQTGAPLGEFSSGYALAGPSKMSVGPDDRIYVTQWDDVQNEVVRFDLDGAFVDEFTSVGAPKGLGHLWDEDGRFYISLYGDSADGTVHRFAADGSDLGTFIDSTRLDGPTDIWRDAAGDFLVEDWLRGEVLRFDSEGVYLGIFLDGMTNPEGIAMTPEGDLLIGDWGEDLVHRFDAAGTYLGVFNLGGDLVDPNNVLVRVW